MKSLELLDSPLVATHKPKEDDLSHILSPVRKHVAIVASTRSAITATYNYAETYQRLFTALRVEPVTAPAMLTPFLTAMGFRVEEGVSTAGEADATAIAVDAAAIAVDAAAIAEINVVWNEAIRASHRWASTFPMPPASSITYPIDFTDREKSLLKSYAAVFLNKNKHFSSADATRAEVDTACDLILKDWPMKKGKIRVLPG
ncbi:hypothetical protein J4E93_000065 [Alternaria ventricosa]|uniref:uncharacterized protein n=1 Tax=Alternaria ventricosa TaxID=1187951 RepID=UPI0020C4FF9A|nr:uncharacterized protein J4E93_000065 [Alternaria ventricosa]KAI4655353.1 hypothetical protein J4E93_000065 [Alternaria ventricosa]